MIRDKPGRRTLVLPYHLVRRCCFVITQVGLERQEILSRSDVMKLAEIKEVLRCEVLVGEDDLSAEVDTVVASDGMSEILAFARPGALMVTGLTNIQSVRTADIANVRAIVYIRGKRPGDAAIDLARKSNIPVLATDLGMFDVCGILRERGLTGGM